MSVEDVFAGGDFSGGRVEGVQCLSPEMQQEVMSLFYFQGVVHCLKETARLGPLAFYKVTVVTLATSPLRAVVTIPQPPVHTWANRSYRSPFPAVAASGS